MQLQILALALLVKLSGVSSPVFAQKPSPKPTKTIVFIHGMYQNGRSWEKWIAYYTNLGYTCHAPSYPYHGGHPDSLRRHIHPKLIQLEFKEVLDSLQQFIHHLPQKPIVIGHSIGGLLAQKLVETGDVEMGIAVAPANPKGINVWNWRYIRSNFRMIDPLRRRDKVCSPPDEWFQFAFFNNMSDSAAKVEREKFFVPESRRLAKSSTYKGNEIDFSKPHVPMLFVAGEKDNDIPPALVKKNYSAYTHKESIRKYRTFSGRSHYICSEPGWQEVAEFVIDWTYRTQISSSLSTLNH